MDHELEMGRSTITRNLVGLLVKVIARERQQQIRDNRMFHSAEMKKSIKNIVRRGARLVASEVKTDKSLVAQGVLWASQLRSISKIHTLADVEISIFSQWGEDGIIEWIIQQCEGIPEKFVEFGVENYRESNTRFLLSNRNWRGLVIDGDARYVETIEADPISHQRDLIAKCAFITSDNIEQLIREAGLAGEIGILSIDIDGNDYWVWKAIDNVRPHIVIVEYNAVFGDLFDLVIPYDPSFERTRAHYSNLYWGASIGAFTRLGREKGYTLLGSNRAGSNAFFVRNDRAPRFLDMIADTAARPSRFRESRDREGGLTLLRGRARADAIAECEVVDLAGGRSGRLDSFGELYSARWLAALD